MSAVPAAHHLAEWGSRPAALRPGSSRADALLVLRRSAEEELTDRLSEATERGRIEGHRAAEDAADLRAAADREQAEARLAAERAGWSETEADRLAGLIVAGLDGIETRLAEAAARILRPRLEEERRERALEAFSDALGALLGRAGRPVIRIEGPRDLIEALRRRLGDKAAAFDCVVSDRPDLRVLSDETVIETRLAAFAASLAEAPRG